MPEVKSYVYSHVELAELLVKKLDIHEGFWGVYFELGHGAANMPTGPDLKSSLQPASITIIQKVGIQKFDSPNNLTVDAAVVNPAKPSSGGRKTHN